MYFLWWLPKKNKFQLEILRFFCCRTVWIAMVFRKSNVSKVKVSSNCSFCTVCVFWCLPNVKKWLNAQRPLYLKAPYSILKWRSVLKFHTVLKCQHAVKCYSVLKCHSVLRYHSVLKYYFLSNCHFMLEYHYVVKLFFLLKCHFPILTRSQNFISNNVLQNLAILF